MLNVSTELVLQLLSVKNDPKAFVKNCDQDKYLVGCFIVKKILVSALLRKL